MDPRATPVRIAQDGARHLRIDWRDGHASRYPVRDLRLACACAHCIEEGTGRALLDPAGVPEDVRPVRIETVGRYGIRIAWSDGHDTGIYTYERLRALCPCCRGAESRA